MKKVYLLIAIGFCLYINAQIVFISKPEHFKPKLEVASCYVMYKEKILFLKRCATCSWGHTWGLPGGKIDKQENPREAMVREVWEETGIDVSRQGIIFLHKVYVRDVQKDFVYYIFKCVLTDEPEKIILAQDEHTEYIWLTAQQALAELSLVPGEDECLRFVFGLN